MRSTPCAVIGPRRRLSLGLLFISTTTWLGVLSFALVKPFPSAQASRNEWHWESLWADSFWQQVSGYGLLGLCFSILLLGSRKGAIAQASHRIGTSRCTHAFLGLLSLGMVGLHTGLSLGANLNRVLQINFLVFVLAGAVSATGAALGFGQNGDPPPRWRKIWGILHVTLAWPLFVLVVFHLVAVYYF